MSIEITNWQPAPAETNRPIFAVGDIHGCADALAALHKTIVHIATEDRLEAPVLVHLGDFIDRGPNSLRVLDLVAAGPQGYAFEQHDLMANHEQLLMLVLERGSASDLGGHAFNWLRNGGDAVLSEAGLGHLDFTDAEEIRSGMRHVLAGSRMALLQRLESHARVGRYLFVHAGISPHLPLDTTFGPGWDVLPETDRDEDRSPLWTRAPFLGWTASFPEDVIVIHGHTITPAGRPEVRPNRIGIDTGAYKGRPLTAVQLLNDKMRFIQVRT